MQLANNTDSLKKKNPLPTLCGNYCTQKEHSRYEMSTFVHWNRTVRPPPGLTDTLMKPTYQTMLLQSPDARFTTILLVPPTQTSRLQVPN